MNFLDLVQNLQEMNKGKIVLIKSGIFYLGIGKDAIILHDLIKTELICYKENICRAGFPENALQKYLEILKKCGVAVVIYDYTNDVDAVIKYGDKKYKVLVNIEGESIELNRSCEDCNACKFNRNKKLTKENIITIQQLLNKADVINDKVDILIEQIKTILEKEDK